MEKDITRRAVLLECLEIQREMWKICSKRYDTLEPKKGMENIWNEQREKCRILKELIRANESEPVRAALANWQQQVIRQGGPPETLVI